MNEHSIWAPRAKSADLVLLPDGQRLAMERRPDGVFLASDSRIRPGQHYAVSLDGGPALPDPRSAHQPDGVHGPSAWVDFDAFEWQCPHFQQVPLGSAVIYELHVGTFTPAGTFEGVIERLPDLVALGVTHLELMPVAHFPGQRGWGYDGVSLFAPHTAYGGPLGLKRLVDACHLAGIAVLLDVVYNHLGPSGNYLGQYGPYFTSRYGTPWGEALNFDCLGSDHVRRFVCDNALHWLRNYRIDGLRLDAIHAIYDQSAEHVLSQLSREVDQLSVALGRHLVVIAESDLNDPRVVNDAERGGHGLSGQWTDDFHHALHAVLTNEQEGYYADYGSLAQLQRALTQGFVYQGQFSRFRDRSFGRPTKGLRGRQFVVFAQNHDQVGNRAVGDRLSASLTPDQLKIAAALTLLAPFVPLLFMGEEWGTRRPFQYFTDHSEPELGRAVREGRRREFEAFGWAPDDIPDPQAAATFEASKLDWQERAEPVHQELLSWYQRLSALRRTHEDLRDDRLERTHAWHDEAARWLCLKRGQIHVVCSFKGGESAVALDGASDAELLMSSHPDVKLSNASVSLPTAGVVILRFLKGSSR